jgi:hypothetical protein
MRSLARHGSGTAVNPLRAEYVQQRSNLRQNECCLGCDIVVGTPRNVIVFRASDATKPFVTPNAELLDRLAPQFEEQLRQYKEDRFLGACAPYEPTQTYRPLPLNRRNFEGTPYGTRSLQRKLQDSGSSSQHVMDQHRRLQSLFRELNSLNSNCEFPVLFKVHGG